MILVAGGKALTRKQWRRFEQVGLRPELDLDELVLNWSDRKVKDLEARGAITAVHGRVDDRGRADRRRSTCATRTGCSSAGGPAASRNASARAAPAPCRSTRAGTRSCRPTCSANRCKSRSTASPINWSRPPTNRARASSRSRSSTSSFTCLKRHKGAKHAPRGKVTRAQFILVARARARARGAQAALRFVCPELNVRQPIDKGASGKKTTGHDDDGDELGRLGRPRHRPRVPGREGRRRRATLGRAGPRVRRRRRVLGPRAHRHGTDRARRIELPAGRPEYRARATAASGYGK